MLKVFKLNRNSDTENNSNTDEISFCGVCLDNKNEKPLVFIFKTDKTIAVSSDIHFKINKVHYNQMYKFHLHQSTEGSQIEITAKSV